MLSHAFTISNILNRISIMVIISVNLISTVTIQIQETYIIKLTDLSFWVQIFFKLKISTQKKSNHFQTSWNFLCQAQSELLARSRRVIQHRTCAFRGQRLSMESQRWLMTTMTMMIMMMTMMTMMILSLNENCHVDDHNTTPNLCIQRSRTIYGVSKVIDDHNDNDDQDDHDDYNDHDDYDDHDGQQTCAFKGQRLSM